MNGNEQNIRAQHESEKWKKNKKTNRTELLSILFHASVILVWLLAVRHSSVVMLALCCCRGNYDELFQRWTVSPTLPSLSHSVACFVLCSSFSSSVALFVCCAIPCSNVFGWNVRHRFFFLSFFCFCFLCQPFGWATAFLNRIVTGLLLRIEHVK